MCQTCSSAQVKTWSSKPSWNLVARRRGPDAVLFEVYRALGDVAVELFWEVANAMLDGSAIPDKDFNLALMVCIPKCADGFLDDNTPLYSAGGTRPISIVDASSRILASKFCAALEKQVGHRIEQAQKGFLKQRQMLRNVLEVDLAAQKISVKSRSGAIMLFDFRAAFPSLSHDMTWDTLEISGVDPQFIKVIITPTTSTSSRSQASYSMAYWSNQAFAKAARYLASSLLCVWTCCCTNWNGYRSQMKS